MLVKATTTIGTGIQYDLGTDNDLVVGTNVIVESTDTNAIIGAGNGQTVTVFGIVQGYDDAINLSGSDATVIIEEGAFVASQIDDGVSLKGINATLINRGTITANYGVYLDATGGTANITNFGTLVAIADGIRIDSATQSVIQNFGLISSIEDHSFHGNILQDLVINRGKMIGDIFLLAGDDLYDGNGGRLRGGVFGGDGNDTFRPGVLAEVMEGGLDVDTLDFRAGGGVSVDLNNVIANTGFAQGDVYTLMERVFGSQAGADRLVGDSVANGLYGFGGTDQLTGNEGNDSLYGGSGKDTLTGGIDDDQFYFSALTGLGDVITDFGVGADLLYIKGSAFGGGLEAGMLDAAQFKVGFNNKAGDRNDRFIFNAGTDTLWFDADGTGKKAAVLLATFSNGVTLDAGDIFIF